MTLITTITAIVFAFVFGFVVSWQIFYHFRFKPLLETANMAKHAIQNSLKLVSTVHKMLRDSNEATKKEEELLLSPYQVNIPGTKRPKKDEEDD